MRSFSLIAALLLASIRRAGPVHLRLWRPHHYASIRSRNGFDSRRLRQHRKESQTLARRPGRRLEPRKQAPQQAKTAIRRRRHRRPQPAPAEQAAAPPAPRRPPPQLRRLPARRNRQAVGHAGRAATQPPASAPAPQAQQEPPPALPPAGPPPARRRRRNSPPKPQPAPPANSPLGVWLTEEKEGKVRIEQCGPNLCGYSVDKKSNQNGEQVLINMKPGKDKWSGRIFDPNSGSTYNSTIALKGSDGCAFRAARSAACSAAARPGAG